MVSSGDPRPGVQRHRAPDLDPERVRRGLRMWVRPAFTDSPEMRPYFFVYSPDSDTRYVCTLEPVLRCYCGDAEMRGNVCKHLCACLLVAGDDEATKIAADPPTPDTREDES